MLSRFALAAVTLVQCVSVDAQIVEQIAPTRIRWDQEYDFDIPQTTLEEAAEQLKAKAYSWYELPHNACRQAIVGPLVGRMTLRLAWHRLLAPTCLKPVISPGYGATWTTYSSEQPKEATCWPPPDTPMQDREREQAEHEAIEYDFDLPRMPFSEAMPTIAAQTKTNVELNYHTKQPDDGLIIVGPYKQRATLLDAFHAIIDQAGLPRDYKRDGFGPFIMYPGCEPGQAELFVTCDCTTRTDKNLVTQLTVYSVAQAIHEQSGSIADYADDLVFAPMVIDRKEIDRSGASSIADVLRNLPQTAFMFTGQLDGAQYISGRGVGAALVTIDRRRSTTGVGAFDTAAGQFDLNNLPLAAVEKLESLPDSGSTLYGLDAIGGLFNIVLRKPENGLVGEVRYGTAQGGAREREATLLAGLGSDQHRAGLIVDWFERGNLMGWERERFSNQDYRRYGGPDRRSTASTPGNLRSMTGDNLPGFTSPIAALPSSAPVGRQLSIQDLGTEANLTSLARYQSVELARERLSLVADGEMLIGGVKLQAEGLYTKQQRANTLNLPMVFGSPLSATHSQNPFGVPVLYEGILTGRPSEQLRLDSTWMQLSVAASGEWRAATWEVSVTHAAERTSFWQTNEVDPFALMSALNPTRGDEPHELDLLSESSGAGLATQPNQVNRSATALNQIVAIANAPLIELPGGDMTASWGVEWRQDGGEFDTPFAMSMPKVERSMFGEFAQMRVPIVSEATQLRGVYDLSLASGVRRDDFQDMGAVTRTQFGFSVRPIKSLRITGSSSQLFSAPSLANRYASDVETPALVFDAVRGETAIVPLKVGGRAGLRPSTSESRSMRIEFEPETQWHLAVEYWRSTVRDRITALSAQVAIDNERALDGRVGRAATGNDGRPGALTWVDGRYDNFGALNASGIDFSIEHSRQLLGGKLSARIQTSWVDTFRFRELPAEAGPMQNRIGVASHHGTITRFRVVGALDWENDAVTLSTRVRYRPHYQDSLFGVVDEVSSRTVAAHSVWDINAAVKLSDQTRLTLGALNVFNAEAPYAGIGYAGYDLSQDDMLGRRVYASLQHSF